MSPIARMCVGCGRTTHHGSRCRSCATEHERLTRNRQHDEPRSRVGLGYPIRERMASAETALSKIYTQKNPLGTRSYQKLAEFVRRNDRYRCRICGAPGRTVDHIVPRHLGGAVFDLKNMRTLCGPCNMVKGGSRMSDADVLAARGRRPAAPTAPSAVVSRDYTGKEEP